MAEPKSIGWIRFPREAFTIARHSNEPLCEAAAFLWLAVHADRLDGFRWHGTLSELTREWNWASRNRTRAALKRFQVAGLIQLESDESSFIITVGTGDGTATGQGTGHPTGQRKPAQSNEDSTSRDRGRDRGRDSNGTGDGTATGVNDPETLYRARERAIPYPDNGEEDRKGEGLSQAPTPPVSTVTEKGRNGRRKKDGKSEPRSHVYPPFITAWRTAYATHFGHESPIPTKGEVIAAVGRASKCPVEFHPAIIAAAFSDPWILDKGVPLGIVVGQWHKLETIARKSPDTPTASGIRNVMTSDGTMQTWAKFDTTGLRLASYEDDFE